MSEPSDPKEGSPPNRRVDDRGDPSRPRLGYPLRRLSDFGSILIVDDQPDTVEILSRLLGQQGFKTLRAGSGEQCLAIARSEPVDTILLDVAMPGMDGLTVCEELAKEERTKSIPVILLTALDDHATRAAAMKLGVSEFLTKPVVKSELFARVRSQLEIRARARQIDSTIQEVPEK